MKVTGSTIQQLDKSKPRNRCRDWRIWATTEEGRKSERFHGTYTQAQERRKRFVDDLEGLVPNAETFGAYAESWRLWRAESGNYSPNTVREDKTKVRSLRRTQLDGMRMDSITPEDCRSALMWLKSNPVHGEAYTNTSMQRFHQTLSSVLGQAVDDGKLASNPMAKVDRPRSDTQERDAMSPDELMLFLNRMDEDVPLDGRSMAVYLMACMGLRRGEACAILDKDIAGGFARVRYNVRDADGSVGGPKSKAGNRVLPVVPRLQEKIDEWRSLRRLLGFEGSPELCCNTNGGRLRPQVLWSWWRLKREKIGCSGMNLHELRHANLSMVSRNMSAFDLQRYAGWSSIGPARIYVHDDMDALTRGVDASWGAIERTKNAPPADL